MAVRKGEVPAMSIDSVKHQDKRANIPTEELRDFVADEEKRPGQAVYSGLLYARDSSLDPQLVWKGKDEQDQETLTVPTVPIYIQEKIHPQAIVEELRSVAKKGFPQQATLFSDFNGIEFEELIDFYHHEQNWTNRMILGDSLLVMNSLSEKENLKGKVQTIYIDPPYGIKFGSNWQVSTRRRQVRDGKAEDLTRQPEQIRAFRDTWQLGVHSYLSYLRDRLVVARELLCDSGSIFVQIGDENQHLVRCLLDEVLGAENFCAMISFRKTGGLGSRLLSAVDDYILWYAKEKELVKFRQLYEAKEVGEEGAIQYKWVETADLRRRTLTDDETNSPDALLTVGAKIFRHDNLSSQNNPRFEFEFRGKRFVQEWKTTLEGLTRLAKAERLMPFGQTLEYIRYLDDFPVFPITQSWPDTGVSGFAGDKVYVVQTTPKVIERCILMTTDPGDLVLDPTCGSGTTAYVAEQWGRRWITIDTSRVALALARTRLMSSRFAYYLLADSVEGAAKEAELSGRPVVSGKTGRDIRKGFVCRRVPHVTLGSIANCPEIDDVDNRWSEPLARVLGALNKALEQSWQEWEVPFDAEETWTEEVKGLLQEWWELRRARRQDIAMTIGRQSDYEYMVDKPYEDTKRVRVAGPFTVESLSPHRALATDVLQAASDVEGPHAASSVEFSTMILQNLKKAGVQNTRKDERLRFDRLEPYAGEWIHAAGEFTDRQGDSKRVAVSIGPEHGTVGAEQIKAAAKEALRGIGFDLLVVCGFAFDAHAGETAKEFGPMSQECDAGFLAAEGTIRFGQLPVMLARMNPDLAMGDELLKKTGAGNLFMVFGEPDVVITSVTGGQVSVEVRGVDVYDPTTGEIRSSSTDDIACWLIDTAYNGESFFVRHAYFTGAGDPYDKLKRALRAEIDAAAWATLYSTKSRPFDRPKTGKVAIKVINHYGDEVLKVYEV